KIERKNNMIDKNKSYKGTIMGFAVAIIGLGLVFGFGPAARTATPSLQPATSSGFQFVADAYGTYATLGNVVVAGKTAVSSLGACGIVEPPVHREYTVVGEDTTLQLSKGVIQRHDLGSESGFVKW